MNDDIVLDGFLDDEEGLVAGSDGNSVRFRLLVSPTDESIDELVLPCSISEPFMARTALADLTPGDQLRVGGCLRLPRSPDDLIWLEVIELEVLAPVPLRDREPEQGAERLADDGLLERWGPYVAFHDPTGRTVLWHEAGTWVGTTDDPATIGGVIEAFERRTSPGDA